MGVLALQPTRLRESVYRIGHACGVAGVITGSTRLCEWAHVRQVGLRIMLMPLKMDSPTFTTNLRVFGWICVVTAIVLNEEGG